MTFLSPVTRTFDPMNPVKNDGFIKQSKNNKPPPLPAPHLTSGINNRLECVKFSYEHYSYIYFSISLACEETFLLEELNFHK